MNKTKRFDKNKFEFDYEAITVISLNKESSLVNLALSYLQSFFYPFVTKPRCLDVTRSFQSKKDAIVIYEAFRI
jgi:hypothetical protein